jgi:peptidoglycan hydrolase CwlO-like protein
MIRNLKTISVSNSEFIDGQELLSNKRIEIEIWERDIYQKKRVCIDIEREVNKLLEDIADSELSIEEKRAKIQLLMKELEEAENELQEFKNDN